MQFDRMLYLCKSCNGENIWGSLCVTRLSDGRLWNLDGVSVTRCMFYGYEISGTFSPEFL